MRLDIYGDHLPGGHGCREATVAEDYAEDLAGLTAPPRSPEPDMLEEARLTKTGRPTTRWPIS